MNNNKDNAAVSVGATTTTYIGARIQTNPQEVQSTSYVWPGRVGTLTRLPEGEFLSQNEEMADLARLSQLALKHWMEENKFEG